MVCRNYVGRERERERDSERERDIHIYTRRDSTTITTIAIQDQSLHAQWNMGSYQPNARNSPCGFPSNDYNLSRLILALD